MERPHLYRIEVDGKWGFINDEGALVVTPQFDMAGTQEDEDVIPVLKNESLGLVNAQGELIRPFDMACTGWPSRFKGGLFCVQHKNGKWGYINTEGETVIDPQFDYAGEFQCGLGLVEKGGISYYINKSGEFVFTQKNKMSPFAYNRARICTLKDIFDSAARFGYVDTSGEMAIPCVYYDSTPYFSNGLVAVSDEMYVDKEGYPELWYRLIDVNGNPVTGTEYRHINSFYFSHASYLREEKGRTVYGVLSLDGTRLLESGEIKFDQCSDKTVCFCANHEEERYKHRQGVMDIQGHVLFQSRKTCVFWDMRNGFMTGLMGDGTPNGEAWLDYFTEDGRQLTDCHFSHAEAFEHTMGYARINEERHVYVNREGRVFHWDDYK